MTAVHVVLPGNIDDPASPSGGNVYDRRVCDGLPGWGWQVHEHAVPGSWPTPADADRAGLAGILGEMPEGSVVLLDGLIASAAADVLVPQANRLQLVVLVHMPLEHDAERDVLGAARAVITTSEWTRRRLLKLYALPPGLIHAAIPGAAAAPLASGSPTGQELLCVAAVTFHKGHDVLADALELLADLSFNLVCAGSLTKEPEFVRGLAGRLAFAGPLTGAALEAAYANADLLVLPSRGETYGMVITEALARGIPVLATNTAGIPEALGHAPDGSLPGILTAPGDPGALAAALRVWLTDSVARDHLRASAWTRRVSLPDWAETAAQIAKVLDAVAAA